MQSLLEAANESQHPTVSTHPDSKLDPAARRKSQTVHREVVESAPLPRHFYRGPRPGRNFPIWDDNENWERRVAEVSAL
jgi:hypothetical protein